MKNFLLSFLGSKARAAILQKLFGTERLELHMRELERHSGLTIGSIQQELKHLSALELVRSRRDGNRLYYRANTTHPCYQEIRGIVIKTTGVVPLLKDALSRDGISHAFIFGSLAQGQETAESDIDLMVIGDLGLRKLATILTDIADATNREINPHVMTRVEFMKRIEAKDHFLTSVMKDKKLFVVGDDDEFEAMVRERLAAPP